MNSKCCFKCGVVRPLDEFYAHPKMSDGRINKCKKCTKQDVARNYWAKHDYYMAYEKSRMYAPQRIAARAAYLLTQAGKKAKRIAAERFRARFPEKVKAHTVVGNAVRDGRLQKMPCVVCGNEIVHAHHDDYSRPLDVTWFCPKHHSEHHRGYS